MGCTSSNADIPLPKIFQIQFKTLNLYIDQLPLFMIQKLKQKFDYYCDHKFELDQSQFHIMYRNAIKNGMANANNNAMAEDSPFYKQFLHRLYQFYTDLNRVKLTFKKFIAKYSILVKGQPTTLSNCLYFLYANNEQNDKNSNIIMKNENYKSFIEQERKFFSFKPSNPDEDVISQEKFYQYLKQSGFLWEDSRRKFMLIDKEDIPFQAITRALIDIDISDFVVGEEYYILSAAWYERWAYYYQGISSQQKQDYYKSTKLVKQRSSIQSGKKRKSIHRTSILKQDLSTLDNTWVIERPTMITFQDIQGEFREELKQNIKGNQEIRIVSKQLWEMFKKTMPAETEYKRVASSVSTLDLYPKSIYYLRTDKDGQIIDSSFKILHISLKKPLKSIQVQNETSGPSAQKYYFIKNFGDNIWNEQSKETALGRCSIYSRFFVVQTTNKTQFIEKYFRNKRSTNSITYGDKVYTFFGFNKKVVPAFVIRLPTENKALIHYLEFNFRYENQVDISDLAVEENQAVLESNKKESAKKNAIENFSFKGISNIGNTCFINSVIQCLIASPILQQYFCKKKFKQDKQPLLYQVSDLAVSLLANKKVSPIKLKKVIDMQMQVFSGYDQHDAQEFLLQLINKMNEQIKKMQKQQETVMEYLFRGKVQTSLQCYSCKKMSKKQQDILSVSLPIPEPEFNTYTVFVFPIYDTRIRKIVLRLHHKCKLNDYLVGIQERLGRAANEYIFAELYSKNLKIRHDVVQNQAREMPLVKMINPSSQIHCFQKFRSAEFMNITEENRSIFKSGDYAYFDYHDAQNERWLYGRFLQKRAKIQIMNQDKSFSVLRQKASDLMKPLGQKNKQLSFKKVITRKYNEALHKMDYFGYYGVNYMIAYPKYVTLAQLERLVDMCLSNFIKSSLKSSKRKPYILRIYELNKQKCIFCKAEEEKIPSKDQIKKCCKLTQQQLNTPLIWVAREKQYSIFVDWTTLEEFNEQFADIQVDNLSSIADKVKTSQKIQIQQCLKLYQQPQNVEIECEKCKHKEHRKTETMKDVPNILVLHMKQYRVTQDMTLVKMDVNLKWIQFLDITKYSINQKGTIYELYAYVRHHGTSQSGHYTCAIKRKHPFENKKVWVNFDDEITGMLGDDLKNIDSAYLLFFQRVDMPTSGYIHFTNF